LDEPYEFTVKLDTPETSSVFVLGPKLKTDAQKIAAKIKGQNSIVSIQGTYTNEIMKPLNDFRDRRLASFNINDVHEIELHHRQMTTFLQRQEGEWKIVKPESMEADKDLVSGFLNRLSTVQIKEFVTDVATDLDKYSLKTPISSVILRGKSDGSSSNATAALHLNLFMGSEDNAKKTSYIKLGDESSVYSIDSANFPKSSMDFRSRNLFTIKKDNIKSSSQKRGKNFNVTVLKTTDGKWKLDGNTQGVLNETAWQKFVNHLEHFTVDRIVGTALNGTMKQYGLESPLATISVEVEENGKSSIEEILVGKETSQKTHYILYKNQLLVCQITPEHYQVLAADWLGKVVPTAK